MQQKIRLVSHTTCQVSFGEPWHLSFPCHGTVACHESSLFFSPPNLAQKVQRTEEAPCVRKSISPYILKSYTTFKPHGIELLKQNNKKCHKK